MVSLKVQGVTELLAGLGAAPEEIDRANLAAMQQSTFIVEGAAKAIEQPHHRSGRLYSSIHGRTESEAGALLGVVGTSVKYGPMIEYGAPVGFPINYRKGRATRYGRTRPYVAHLRHARAGRHFLKLGLLGSVVRIGQQFKIAADRVVARIASK